MTGRSGRRSLLAACVAGFAGILLAIPALRVRGPYLAMVTIAFAFVVEQGAAEWQDMTGGWNGLSGIPSPTIFGTDIGEKGIAFLTVALTALALAAFSRLSGSFWGNAMRAVRDLETAEPLDWPQPDNDPHRRPLPSRRSSPAIAGGVYASISSFISPELFPFFQSILFLLVVMLGGADRVLGPLIGACVVVLLPEMLAALGEYRLLFVGVLMLAGAACSRRSVSSASPRGCFRQRSAKEHRVRVAMSPSFLTSEARAIRPFGARPHHQLRRRAGGEGPQL